jgi:hypothetical protein
MVERSIYDEIAGFMAGMDPKKVIAFKPSEANQNRMDALLDKQQEEAFPPPSTSPKSFPFLTLLSRFLPDRRIRLSTLSGGIF